MSISYLNSALKQRLGGRNLFLVGMMGSGKSSTGPYLAKGLAYSFIDSDEVVEQAYGKSIPKIFQIEGEAGFRDLETQVLNQITQRHSLVVATGGGVVTRSQNWGMLHQGIVIWLDPGRDRLINRLLEEPGDRPLLQKENPMSAFDELFNERQKFYAEADLHLNVGDEEPESIAREILNLLPSILRPTGDQGAPQTIEG